MTEPPGWFDSVPTSQQQQANIETVRRQCDALAATLRAALGGGDRMQPHEGCMAMDRLTEFSMWANRAISRNGTR